jgi:hypothetical protein
MTHPNNTKKSLNDRDWQELEKLRKNITSNISLTNTNDMEKFTHLLVRSLEGKGNYPHNSKQEPTNY